MSVSDFTTEKTISPQASRYAFAPQRSCSPESELDRSIRTRTRNDYSAPITIALPAYP